jgi:hypothetical protein
MGLEPVKKIFQIDNIDDELRNRLWNVFNMEIFDKVRDKYIAKIGSSIKDLCNNIWSSFYKENIDDIPYYTDNCKKKISEYFFKSKWHEVYNFLEF